jgi:hypothetical protein
MPYATRQWLSEHFDGPFYTDRSLGWICFACGATLLSPKGHYRSVWGKWQHFSVHQGWGFPNLASKFGITDQHGLFWQEEEA